MRDAVRNQLIKYADDSYKDFSAGLIPGASPLLGVRLPQLRKLAKDIVRNTLDGVDWRTEIAVYDGAYQDLYFEETMLRGMIIGYGTAKRDISCGEGLALLEEFIPYIDNWSVCDSFCISFVFANRFRDEVWEFLQPYLYSAKEYEVRVAFILLLAHYLKYDRHNKKKPRNKTVSMADLEESHSNKKRCADTAQKYPYLGKILTVLNRNFTQGYYAQMAAAWTLAETFINFPYETNQMMIRGCKLDDWTFHKTLQKIRESQNPDQEVKEYIKHLKGCCKNR